MSARLKYELQFAGMDADLATRLSAARHLTDIAPEERRPPPGAVRFTRAAGRLILSLPASQRGRAIDRLVSSGHIQVAEMLRAITQSRRPVWTMGLIADIAVFFGPDAAAAEALRRRWATEFVRIADNRWSRAALEARDEMDGDR